MERKAIACAAVLMMLFLVFAGCPAAIAETESEYVVDIDRVVNIGNWGLVTINDTVTVRNNSTSLLRDVPLGLPRDYLEGLKYLGATDAQGMVLTIDRDLDPADGTYWYRVNFARSVAYNETYTFKVTSVFTGLLTSVSGGYQFRFVRNPVLRVRGISEALTVVAGFQARIGFPEDLNMTQSPETEAMQMHGTLGPVEPYTAKPLVLNMTNPEQQIVRVLRAERLVSIDADGKLRVSDTYDFESLAGSVSQVELTLPENSTDVMAYDSIGRLWDDPKRGPNISVSPRYSGGIGANRTFSFTVKYTLQSQAYLKQKSWWGSCSFKFALASSPKDWVVEKLRTVIVMPSGLHARSVSPSPSSTSVSLFQSEFEYELNDVTAYTELALDLEYDYVPFWSGSLLVFWTLMAELAVVALVIVARLRRPPALKMLVPTESLKEFVEFYDGRTALRNELERMTEDLTRGALNKHEYRRRRKTIELRMSEMDRALQPLRQELKAFHPRYNEILLRMEKAEGEIDTSRLSEDHFRSQYRTGRISKEAFEIELRDLNRRADKAKEVIETSLVTLREEAR
jgi:hypothetical protein